MPYHLAKHRGFDLIELLKFGAVGPRKKASKNVQTLFLNTCFKGAFSKVVRISIDVFMESFLAHGTVQFQRCAWDVGGKTSEIQRLFPAPSKFVLTLCLRRWGK